MPYFIVIRGHCICALIFKHYLKSGTIFGEIFIEIKTCFLIFCIILYKKILILGRNERVIFVNVHMYWRKVQVQVRVQVQVQVQVRVILVSSSYMSMRPTAFEIFVLYIFLNI